MLLTAAAEKSAKPPLVVIEISTVPAVVVFTTVNKLSSAVVPVEVPKPSISSKPTLSVTFCVPLTLT